MNKRLILLDKQHALSKLPAIIDQDDLCYYLSKDYPLYIKLGTLLPEGCQVLNLAGKFQQEIKRLRKAYLDVFAKLSENYNSLEWWGTHLASRNSVSIPLQLNITYLFCAKEIIDKEFGEKSTKRIIIVADSQALLDSISILAKQRNITVIQPRKKIRKATFNVKQILLYIYRIITFLWRCYRHRRLAFSILKPILEDHSFQGNRIVFRSWVTKGTLNKEGIYKDRNFGILPERLSTKGYKILIFPMFFNLDMPLKEIYMLMKDQNVQFLSQYHYLKFKDYLNAIYIAFKQINIPLKKITLESQNITLLFREIQLQQGFNRSLLTSNLCYPLLRRMKESGIDIVKFYYPFENNVPEKQFILGCNNYYPESEVIAYQHTVWFEDQLGMFLSNDEAKYHPIADKIICSGPIYLDVLKKAGFPENILIPGPNLRFTSVHKNNATLKQKVKRPNILLTLTFDIDLAYELINKVKVLSESVPDLSVYIRTHPALSEIKLSQFMNRINMSDYQYANEGDIQDWLANTDIVITTGSSVVIVETVSMGVPLVRVEPDNYFFLDPLAWSYYPIKPVNSLVEIVRTVNSIIGMEKEDRDKFRVMSEGILLEYFSEIDEDKLRIFG